MNSDIPGPAPGMERGSADAARGCHLTERIMIGVQQAKRFCRAVIKIGFIALKRLHSSNINIAKIKGPCAVFHPLRQCHPGPAG